MYKIYAVQTTRSGLPAVVVVTGLKNPGGYFVGESFTIFPEPYAGHAFKRMRFAEQNVVVQSKNVDEEFMLRQALEQARSDVRLHTETHFSSKLDQLLPSGTHFEDAGMDLLVQLQVRGQAPFVRDLIHRTGCEILRSELQTIIELPVLKVRDVSVAVRQTNTVHPQSSPADGP